MRHDLPRLIFIGYKHLGATGLTHILNSPQIDGKYNVVGVITTGPSLEPRQLVKKIGHAFGLPVFDGDIRSDEAHDWIRALRPDYGVVMQYRHRIPKSVIELFSHYMINVHPSDLPKNRGGSPFESTILHREKLVITVHRVTPAFDTGAWIFKTKGEDIENVDIDTLYTFCAARCAKAVEEALIRISKGHEEFSPQDTSEATYAWLHDVGEVLTIHWEEDDVLRIHRKVLAGGENRGAIAYLNGPDDVLEVRITEAFVRTCKHDHPPGTVLDHSDGMYQVACKGGFLHILSLMDQAFSTDGERYREITQIMNNCKETKVSFV